MLPLPSPYPILGRHPQAQDPAIAQALAQVPGQPMATSTGRIITTKCIAFHHQVGGDPGITTPGRSDQSQIIAITICGHHRQAMGG